MQILVFSIKKPTYDTIETKMRFYRRKKIIVFDLEFDLILISLLNIQIN
jgi:hypothetical protein